MSTTRILHVLGIDDSNCVEVQVVDLDPSRTRFVYTGNVALLPLLDADRFSVLTVIRGGMEIRGGQIPPIDVILCGICDADTNQAALKSALTLVEEVPVPVINHPRFIQRTARDQIYELCRDLPLRLPQTLRLESTSIREFLASIEDARLPPPFLVREAGTHGGKQLELIRDGEDLELLDQFAFDGRAHYVTEFVDFASPDGLYRKYRVLVIGGQPYARHVIIADSWNVHMESRDRLMADRPDLQQAETDALASFQDTDQSIFGQLYERLQLDYFGVDFALGPDGRLIVFEINACCRPLVGPDELRSDNEVPDDPNAVGPHIDAIRTAFSDLVECRARTGVT